MKFLEDVQAIRTESQREIGEDTACLPESESSYAANLKWRRMNTSRQDVS